MQITPKTRLICLIVTLVFLFGALIGTGTYLIINHLNNKALIGDYNSIGNILTDDGNSLNAEVCATLLGRIGNRTGGATTLENGGDPIVFTMAGHDWQVVYRDKSEAENVDVLTVLMVGPYSNLAFDQNADWASGETNYVDATMYGTVNEYYNSQLATFPALSQIVVTPNDVSTAYQEYQKQQYSQGNYTSEYGELNGSEYFWLPSFYELFNLWELDDNDRSFVENPQTVYWMRSGALESNNYVLLVTSIGTVSSGMVLTPLGICPAAHLSLEALAEIVEQTTTPITLTENIYTTDGNIRHENDTATYTAHQIASRNNTVGYKSDRTIIFPLGYVNGTSGESIYWRATYLHNNYLTIWMDKAYTNSTWNSSGGTVSYNSYANSTIQNYLDNTLWSALTMGSGTLQSIFALPTTVGYQDEGDENLSNNNSDTSYWVNSSRTSTFDNLASSVYNGSYLWIPSFGEVFNNTLSEYDENDTTIYTGQWGLNNTDRSFNTNNYDGTTATYDYCWLRSGRTGPGSDNYAMQVHFSGVSTNGPIDGSRGVRPAAHLDLDALYRSTLPAITITTNNAEYGQVFADGQIGEIVTTYVVAGEQASNLIAIPNAGYAFLYWENASTHEIFSELNPLSFEVTSDTALTAIFGKSVDGVVVTASAGGEVRLVGFDNTATQDTDTITLIAVAYTGYTFSGWYIDGELINADYGASARISYSLIKDKIVTAIFTPSTNQGDMNSQTDNNYTDDFV